MKDQIQEFLNSNPSDEEIESFYIHKVLPFDKRSMNEILTEDI